MKQRIPAVAYYRYSAGGKQTDQSIDGQRTDCEAYAAKHGYRITREFIDRHISGKTDNRPAFQQLMEAARRREFTTLICWKSDRLARNRKDINVFRDLLKQSGVRILYSDMEIPTGPEGIILESVLDGINEWYSADLRQKVIRGLRESANKRQAAGGNIPFGLMLDKNKHFVPDPATAPIVKWIFGAYANGSTAADIMTALNAKGITNRRGNQWSKGSLAKMLHNEKYIGVYEYMGVRDEEEIEPIVEREIFDRVQQRLSDGRRAGGRRKAKKEYALSGIAVCALCGAPLVGLSGTSRDGTKHYYYTCSNRRNGGDCKKRSVKLPLLESAVVDTTLNYVLSPEILTPLAAQIAAASKQSDQTAAELAAATTALKDTERKLKNIVAAIEDGNYSQMLSTRLTQLEAEQASWKRRIKELRSERPAIDADRLEFFLLSMIQSKNEDDSSYIQRILNNFIESISVNNQEIEITYKVTGAEKKAVGIPTASPPCKNKKNSEPTQHSHEKNLCLSAVNFGGDNPTESKHFFISCIANDRFSVKSYLSA